MSNKDRSLHIVKYALYSLGILLLFSFLSPVLGIGIGLVQNILFIVLGAEIVLCCSEYKKKTNDVLNYKGAFAMGWQMVFITGLLNAIVVLIAIKALGELNFLNEISKHKSIFMSQGVTDEAALDNLIKFIANPWVLFCLTLVFYTTIGFFLSVIIAFFVRTTATSTNNEEQY